MKKKVNKKEVKLMIDTIKAGDYDEYSVHAEYDDLLERFILNYDKSIAPLMKELINLQKYFEY